MRVSSTDVQNNFGRYLKFVEVNEAIIVTKNGKDVATIVPCVDSYGVREGAQDYMTRGSLVTYEEFLELTEESDQRFELIDGVVYNLASPSYKHQYAIQELQGTLYNWFKGKQCTPITSPFDVTIFKSSDNICVVQPDILILCDKDNIDKDGKYIGTPTVVIEVLSPSTRTKDMLKKLDLYMQCGTKEYWIVDPIKEYIDIYSFENHTITDKQTYTKGIYHEAFSVYFDGLKVKLQDVFVS